jgi:hypothetical protein
MRKTMLGVLTVLLLAACGPLEDVEQPAAAQAQQGALCGTLYAQSWGCAAPSPGGGSGGSGGNSGAGGGEPRGDYCPGGICP